LLDHENYLALIKTLVIEMMIFVWCINFLLSPSRIKLPLGLWTFLKKTIE